MTPIPQQSRTHRLSRFCKVSAWASSLLVPLFAHAQFGQEVVGGYEGTQEPLPRVILNIINFVLILVGVLALAYLVYGGFRYITSRGDETAVEEAKGIITNAVIGIVVIGIAAAVVNFVIQAILVA